MIAKIRSGKIKIKQKQFNNIAEKDAYIQYLRGLVRDANIATFDAKEAEKRAEVAKNEATQQANIIKKHKNNLLQLRIT
jgi:hypothetical protein